MKLNYPSWVNGIAETKLSVTDRAIAYGDGVFETIRVLPRPVLADDHFDRLVQGLKSLDIPFAPQSLTNLRNDFSKYLQTHQPGIIKIIVSRGSGGRGYAAPEQTDPRVIIQGFELPDYSEQWYREGVDVFVCKTPLGSSPALQGIKHLNRLEQVLARNEFSADDYQEGLMADSSGSLVEGTVSNLFFYRGDTVYTPAISRCAVRGTMQQYLINDCRDVLGTVTEADSVTVETLKQADGAFLCNSVFGIWPIKAIMGESLNLDYAIVRALQQKTQTLFQ